MARTLLQKVADGDAAAVEECLRKYRGLVWSLARRFCPTHEDAEDAVQEIFVEIWRKASRFNPEVAAETTYITMIARRRLIDRYRRGKRHIDTSPLSEQLIASDADHQKQTEVAEQAAHVRQHLGRLRPEERKVLELSISQGLTQAQIAEATNLPLGTVKTHARRGLMRLRAMLGVDSTG